MSMDSKDFPGPKHILKKKSDIRISCITKKTWQFYSFIQTAIVNFISHSSCNKITNWSPKITNKRNAIYQKALANNLFRGTLLRSFDIQHDLRLAHVRGVWGNANTVVLHTLTSLILVLFMGMTVTAFTIILISRPAVEISSHKN